jgi:Domain of unknown function (DUF4432)
MKFHVGKCPELQFDVASALDIGSCRLGGVELSPGRAVPDDGDPRILHSVGGFLFTCGPDHIRHPEPIRDGKGRKYPLHGSMAGTKAEIIARNSRAGSEEIVARIIVRMADGGEAEVLRTWRMHGDTGAVTLEDRLTNVSKRPFPPMLMYHMNIGAHLFDDQTMLAGAMMEGGEIGWTFGEGDGHVFCVPAGETDMDGFATVTLGPIAPLGGRRLEVRFAVDTIPHLQMWRNQAAPAHVLGIEPVSHPWKKRDELEAAGLMAELAPGDSQTYRLGFRFV